MADFPHAKLGYPLVERYGFQPQPASDRLQPLRGPPVFRFRQATPPETFTISWRWTEEQLEYFRWWVHVDSDRLNTWFTIDLRVGQLPNPENLIGAELVEREVHFVEPPSVEFDGALYRVTATLDAKWATPATPL